VATLSKDKLDKLKRAFIDDALSPTDAAKAAGTAYATAMRYYEKWGDEIKRERERLLMPQLEASLNRLGKNLKKKPAKK
jgi:transposase-like protein